jgi:hypothetical protein
VDGGVSSCLAGGIRDLLLIEDADAQRDDADQHHHEQREDQGELDQGLSTLLSTMTTPHQ